MYQFVVVPSRGGIGDAGATSITAGPPDTARVEIDLLRYARIRG